MKIKIKDKEIELRQTFRTLMIYENIAKETFVNEGSMTSILLYFYCNVLACSDGDLIEFEEFIDYIDNNKSVLAEYTDWLVKINKVDNLLKPVDKNVEKKRKSTKVNS